MSDNARKTCIECQGEMSEIFVMDRDSRTSFTPHALAYRQPDDKRSFWTGRYPTAGNVLAFMCGNCGRIALYGFAPDGDQAG